jgi:hypothetical protein
MAQSKMVYSSKMEDVKLLERLRKFNRLRTDLHKEFGNLGVGH